MPVQYSIHVMRRYTALFELSRPAVTFQLIGCLSRLDGLRSCFYFSRLLSYFKQFNCSVVFNICFHVKDRSFLYWMIYAAS